MTSLVRKTFHNFTKVFFLLGLDLASLTLVMHGHGRLAKMDTNPWGMATLVRYDQAFIYIVARLLCKFNLANLSLINKVHTKHGKSRKRSLAKSMEKHKNFAVIVRDHVT